MMYQNDGQANSASEPVGRNSSGAAMDRRVEKVGAPWWRSRRTLLFLAVVALVFFGWRLLPASGSTDVDEADVQTSEVERANFEDYVPVRASVVPATTTLVGVTTGGQVEELFIQDGALVSKGQPLARLTNLDLELLVLNQEAQIAGQLGSVAGESLSVERSQVDRTSQVAAVEYDLVRARRELDIRKQLHDKGIVSDAGLRSYQEEVDYQTQRLSQLRSGRAAESRITATQGALLDATRARLQRNLGAVRSSLDTLTIRAPMAGRLTNFVLQPGQTLTPGDPAGQIDSEGDWKLEANVEEYYLGRISIGQKASAGEDAMLTVSKVFPTVSDGRFRIELTFDRLPRGSLNRGQTLDVRLVLGAASRALVVPNGAWLANGGSSVFVLDPDGGHARRVPVEIGRRNPRQVEIISGIEEGQRIVISDLSHIEGDTINIR